MINCQRMHLFDVVNQYRAIFADDTSGSEENYEGGLLFSWAMHQITTHLKTLKVMLPRITEGGSLSNILDQCMVRTSFICIIAYHYQLDYFFMEDCEYVNIAGWVASDEKFERYWLGFPQFSI